MSRGPSGRIVVDVGVELKRNLYVALEISGSTLKSWFEQQASAFCNEVSQPSLFPSEKPKRGTATAAAPRPKSAGQKKR